MKNKKVVYGFMVADLLHEGHVRYIKQSKALGDYLILGVLTDEAAETYKRRPIMLLRERMLMVNSIKGVDEVVVQRSRDPSSNILKYRPDVVTHGDDWAVDTFPGKGAMKEVGAQLVFTKYFKGQSSSKIIKKIREKNGGQENQHGQERLVENLGHLDSGDNNLCHH